MRLTGLAGEVGRGEEGEGSWGGGAVRVKSGGMAEESVLMWQGKLKWD